MVPLRVDISGDVPELKEVAGCVKCVPGWLGSSRHQCHGFGSLEGFRLQRPRVIYPSTTPAHPSRAMSRFRCRQLDVFSVSCGGVEAGWKSSCRSSMLLECVIQNVCKLQTGDLD